VDISLPRRGRLTLTALLTAVLGAALVPATVAGAAAADRVAVDRVAADRVAVLDGPVDLRVGSFNVRSVTTDGTGGLPWRDRRPAVVRDILGERVDVLGVQELSQNAGYANRLEDGPNQMLDLVAGLAKAGGTYALTNTAVANCVRDWTQSKCEYQYRGASRSTRILYNTATVQMLSQGSHEYRVQSSKDNDTRYLVWATFRVLATGDEFFFANTHLVNGSISQQKAQTVELIEQVERLRGDLPVIVVGDFQKTKFSAPIDFTLKAMKSAGFGDVLDQRFETPWVPRHRAQKRINGWFNTMNRLKRDVRPYAYEDNRKKLGNNIDWVFASNELAVPAWKVVVRYDKQRLRLKGIIPSDHFMVRATITLP
jgi:endonuclease/exonuclease/phosphatase family metal-dependent hydrolase